MKTNQKLFFLMSAFGHRNLRVNQRPFLSIQRCFGKGYDSICVFFVTAFQLTWKADEKLYRFASMKI